MPSRHLNRHGLLPRPPISVGQPCARLGMHGSRYDALHLNIGAYSDSSQRVPCARGWRTPCHVDHAQDIREPGYPLFTVPVVGGRVDALAGPCLYVAERAGGISRHRSDGLSTVNATGSFRIFSTRILCCHDAGVSTRVSERNQDILCIPMPVSSGPRICE